MLAVGMRVAEEHLVETLKVSCDQCTRVSEEVGSISSQDSEDRCTDTYMYLGGTWSTGIECERCGREVRG